MSDVWVSVMSHLTPREARHLIAVVRGLKVTMCKTPFVNDFYIGGCECPGLRLQRDVEFLSCNYPRFMLQPVDFSCIVEVSWDGENGQHTSMVGIDIKFSNKSILYTYRFRVDST